MSARVKFTYPTGSVGNYTQNKEYEVLGFSTDGTAVYACVIDDANLLAGVHIDQNVWVLSQFYTVEKVV